MFKKYFMIMSSFLGFYLSPIAQADCFDCDRPPVCTRHGIVLGVQAGYADTHWDNINNVVSNPISDELFPEIESSSSKDNGFAARGYLGFDMTPFFGIETGYVDLPSASVTTNFADGTVITDNISNYAVDLLGKLMIPLANGFSLYAKAGAGYFHSSFDDGGSASHIGPAYGVGAAYEIIPNLAIDLSWMRYSGDNEIFNDDGTLNNNYQPDPDLVLVGISYKFPLYSHAN